MSPASPKCLPSGISLTRTLARCGAITTYAASLGGETYRVHEFAPIDIAARNAQGEWLPSTARGAAEAFERGCDAFANTGQTLRSLDTPGLLTPRKVESAHGTVYWVTDGPDVKSLRETAHHQTFGIDEITRIAAEAMALLEQMHRAGLMHLGLSPDALLLSADGTVYLDRFGGWRVHLGDAIRRLPSALPTGFTAVETLHPEHFEHGGWTDVYALAATLFWAHGTAAPPDVSQRLQVFDATGLDPPVRLPERMPPIMGKAVRSALALIPESRPPGIDEWRSNWRIPERTAGPTPVRLEATPRGASAVSEGALTRLSSALANAAAVAGVVLLAAVITLGVGSGILEGPEKVTPTGTPMQMRLADDGAWARDLPTGTFTVELFRTSEPVTLVGALESLERALHGHELRIGRVATASGPMLRVLTGQFPNHSSAAEHARALSPGLPAGYAAAAASLTP